MWPGQALGSGLNRALAYRSGQRQMPVLLSACGWTRCGFIAAKDTLAGRAFEVDAASCDAIIGLVRVSGFKVIFDGANVGGKGSRPL